MHHTTRQIHEGNHTTRQIHEGNHITRKIHEGMKTQYFNGFRSY